MFPQFTKHEVVLGKRVGSEIVRPQVAGHAFLNEGDNFYTVKLMVLPGQTYYLVKNRDSTSKYTVFAKLIKTDDGQKFQNPVGLGQLFDDIMYLEIYFPIWRTHLYMSLYPSDK